MRSWQRWRGATAPPLPPTFRIRSTARYRNTSTPTFADDSDLDLCRVEQVGKPCPDHTVMEVVRQRNAANRLPRRRHVIERIRRQRLGNPNALLGVTPRLVGLPNLAKAHRERIGVLGC